MCFTGSALECAIVCFSFSPLALAGMAEFVSGIAEALAAAETEDLQDVSEGSRSPSPAKRGLGAAAAKEARLSKSPVKSPEDKGACFSFCWCFAKRSTFVFAANLKLELSFKFVLFTLRILARV